MIRDFGGSIDDGNEPQMASPTLMSKATALPAYHHSKLLKAAPNHLFAARPAVQHGNAVMDA